MRHKKTSIKIRFYRKLSYLTALIAEMIQIKMNNPPKRTMKNIAAKSFANIAAMLHYFLQINMPISDYGAMHFNNWRLIYLETVTERKNLFC